MIHMLLYIIVRSLDKARAFYNTGSLALFFAVLIDIYVYVRHIHWLISYHIHVHNNNTRSIGHIMQWL